MHLMYMKNDKIYCRTEVMKTISQIYFNTTIELHFFSKQLQFCQEFLNPHLYVGSKFLKNLTTR